jgi:hypothetical protein
VNQSSDRPDAGTGLRKAAGASRFGCILADPPWQFVNRTGKVDTSGNLLAARGLT